jgi:hypothetical protein
MKERNELHPDPLNREAYVMLEAEQRSVGGSSYVQEAWMKENGDQKGRLSETVHKELRVAISGNRSPIPLRSRSGHYSWASGRCSTARGGSGGGSSASRPRGWRHTSFTGA